ncbi:hypothetical protein EYC84_003938 [Monilinia fructicola]|uniref:Uncharacterized protein n=1 Tax=Monilinia fructicola TaxID=38448 RepID=A0A5M9JYS5_MONFR|nr:hypothetical protein EYC84_003938 [Monilinia fructicola]
MFLGSKGPRVQIETSSEGQPDGFGGEDFGEPDPNVVGTDLHEEDGVWGRRGTVGAHLRQESPGCNKYQRQEEIAKCDGRFGGVVLKTDNSTNLPRNVPKQRVIVAKLRSRGSLFEIQR